MFRHSALLVFLHFILVFSLVAQPRSGGNRPPGATITGTILDENKAPIPYASVALFRSKDSSLVRGVASNETGKFRLRTRSGDYYLKISFLSYVDQTIPNIKVGTEPVLLPPTIMKSGSEDLEEITVTAEKRQMELKLDKRVFNVDKDLSNTGSNASEVLDNIPSVEVDVDGNVSLRGSQNVRILIDGKPSGLVGMSSTDALRQLQGNLIEKVEVITNPSARYDAEGEVGIINIVLKKEKQKGLNGAIDLHTGYPDNHGASYNLNYRRKNINLFSGIGITFRENPGSGSSSQEFFNSDSASIFENEREHQRGGWSNNFRLGADLSLNDFESIALSGFYQRASNDNEVDIIYNDFTSSRERLQTVNRSDREEENKEVIELNLNYRRTFKRKGQEWTVDLKANQNDDRENSNLTQFSDNPDVVPLIQRTRNQENQENLLFQSDFVRPFKKDGKYEAGVKSTLRIIDNDYTLEQRESDGNFRAVPRFDNQFIYTEYIHAAYAMAGNKKGAFSYQFGLRTEWSDIQTELVETNEKNNQNYVDVFPSAHFSYELKKENSVQLSYSRRISRPHFWNLLPFFGLSDVRNFYSGNPDLRPEYGNSVELGHLKYWEKGSLLSSIYYRYKTGVVERINLTDSAGSTRRFPVNLSTQNAYGIEFNFSHSPLKWLRLNLSSNFYRAITSGSFEGQRLTADTYTWTSRGNSKFSLNKKTDLQISYTYRAPRETTQGRAKSIYFTNIGLSREILKNKATLNFSARDIFNTRKRRTITDVDEFYAESEFQWRSRQFRVSLNYRINQKKKRTPQRFTGGDFGGEE